MYRNVSSVPYAAAPAQLPTTNNFLVSGKIEEQFLREFLNARLNGLVFIYTHGSEWTESRRRH